MCEGVGSRTSLEANHDEITCYSFFPSCLVIHPVRLGDGAPREDKPQRRGSQICREGGGGAPRWGQPRVVVWAWPAGGA